MTQNPTPLRHGPDVWTAVRADYLAGVSAPVLAERYTVSERSVRRRAAAEGWRREDAGAGALRFGPPPASPRAGDGGPPLLFFRSAPRHKKNGSGG